MPAFFICLFGRIVHQNMGEKYAVTHLGLHPFDWPFRIGPTPFWADRKNNNNLLYRFVNHVWWLSTFPFPSISSSSSSSGSSIHKNEAYSIPRRTACGSSLLLTLLISQRRNFLLHTNKGTTRATIYSPPACVTLAIAKLYLLFVWYLYVAGYFVFAEWGLVESWSFHTCFSGYPTECMRQITPETCGRVRCTYILLLLLLLFFL